MEGTFPPDILPPKMPRGRKIESSRQDPAIVLTRGELVAGDIMLIRLKRYLHVAEIWREAKYYLTTVAREASKAIWICFHYFAFMHACKTPVLGFVMCVVRAALIGETDLIIRARCSSMLQK